MSPRSSEPKVKPSPDIYVALLFVGLAALLFAIWFLCRELEEYGWQTAPSSGPAAFAPAPPVNRPTELSGVVEQTITGSQLRPWRAVS